MIDTHTTNWTEGLSLFWGLYMIVAGLLILFMPNLRDRASETLQSKSGRTFLASICFLVTLIHLGVYQGLYEGSDLLLITIGYLSAIKGLILLTSPTVLAITEKSTGIRIYFWLVSFDYDIRCLLVEQELSFYNIVTI
jgi:uncharacterized membrane protein HdeD (DUF308 family)